MFACPLLWARDGRFALSALRRFLDVDDTIKPTRPDVLRLSDWHRADQIMDT